MAAGEREVSRAVDLDAISAAFNADRATSSIVESWFCAQPPQDCAAKDAPVQSATEAIPMTGSGVTGLRLGLGAAAPTASQRAAGIRTDSVIGTQLLRKHMLGNARIGETAQRHARSQSKALPEVIESRAMAFSKGSAQIKPAILAPPAKKRKRSKKERLAL